MKRVAVPQLKDKESLATPVLKRAGSPRLRRFLEECLSEYGTRKEAAARLEISPTELSFFTQGSRTPSAEQILKFTTSQPSAVAPRVDFRGNLDQRLIDGGYAPFFYKHLVPIEGRLLRLMLKDGVYVESDSAELPPGLADLRFACRHAGAQIAVIETENTSSYLILEPIWDDTDLCDNDIAVFAAENDEFYFGRLTRDNPAQLAEIDPVTVKDLGRSIPIDTLDLRARMLLRFEFPSEKPRAARTAARSIRALDRLNVGVSPFQDALLVSVGVELGFFEEEGLLVQLEPVEWYDWQRFFYTESANKLVFTNLFSFIREYTLVPQLRFLYGVNLFDNGFKLLSKYGNESDEEPTLDEVLASDRNPTADSNRIYIGTISESDWAAQLFSLCKTKGYNLGVSSGPFEDLHIYPLDGPLPGRPTVMIADSNRQAGVVTDPEHIDRTQNFYFGSLPQRLRLKRDFGWKEIDVRIPDPFPINGFVGTAEQYTKNVDVLLRFLRVWFRIVNYISKERRILRRTGGVMPPADAGSRIIQRALESNVFGSNIAKLGIGTGPDNQNEILNAWDLEQFPTTPAAVKQVILGDGKRSPWRQDAQRAIEYLGALFHKKDAAPHASWNSLRDILAAPTYADENQPFLLEVLHQAYVSRYGEGAISRNNLDGAPAAIPTSIA
jgi:hypothetical protein